MEIDRKNDDLLINTLPVIKEARNTYIIFSPYKQVFICLDKQQINDERIVNSLEKSGVFDFPVFVKKKNMRRIVMTVTKRCNLFCKYCFAKSGPEEKQEMSPKAAIGIVRNILKNNDIDRIHFTGGEPTLNLKVIKEVVSLLELERKPHLPIFYITTNGIMSKKKLTWLIEKKFAFSVSWDGINDNQRTYLDGRKSDNVTRSTIIKVSQSGLPLRVRMAVSKINFPYLLESVKWLAQCGVKFIHIDPITPDGRGEEFIKNYGINNDDFISEFFKIVEFAEKNDIWILNSALANLYNPRNYYCTSFKDQVCHFNPDGSISFCYRIQTKLDDYADSFVVGEFDGESISIFGRKAKELSLIDVEGYSACDKEPYKYFFSSGCPLRNYSVKEDWKKINNNSMEFSKLIYREAILHLYKRAKEKKNSSLEGYMHFYRYLVPDIFRNREIPTKNPTFDSPIFKTFNDFIPLTTEYLDYDIDIDACDICI